MPSPPAHHVDEYSHPLFSLPAEVTNEIFGNLSSFVDVFAFAATCRRLRHVWIASVNPIYNTVAPRSIPCDGDARRFLVDQHGTKLESPMTPTMAIQIVRNASIVEKAMLQFEEEIVRKVVCQGGIPDEVYGDGTQAHPPTLTETERTRFIRTYYSLWGLMRLDRKKWNPRLEAMSCQQLHHLHDVVKWNQSIGHEEVEDLGKREALKYKARGTIHHISQRFFQQDCWIASGYAHRPELFVIWDHWQSLLKDSLCNPSYSIRPSPEDTKRYLWDDNFDKEWIPG